MIESSTEAADLDNLPTLLTTILAFFMKVKSPDQVRRFREKLVAAANGGEISQDALRSIETNAEKYLASVELLVSAKDVGVLQAGADYCGAHGKPKARTALLFAAEHL